MNFRRRANRAALPAKHRSNTVAYHPEDETMGCRTTENASEPDSHSDATAPASHPDVSEPTPEQRREWRRWIVEAFIGADYGVIPVSHLATYLADRDPEPVTTLIVSNALTETVLPTLDSEGVVDYNADRAVVINYGH